MSTLTTAKRGNPRDASRGDAVRKARMDLIAAIERSLCIEVHDDATEKTRVECESLTLAKLMELAGTLTTDAALELWRTSTLGQVEDWISSLSTPPERGAE